MQFAPPGPEEKEIRAKLARIGIGAGKTFDFKDLDLKHKVEVGLGMKAGEKKVEAAVASAGKDEKVGWSADWLGAIAPFSTATGSNLPPWRKLESTRMTRLKRCIL